MSVSLGSFVFSAFCCCNILLNRDLVWSLFMNLCGLKNLLPSECHIVPIIRTTLYGVIFFIVSSPCIIVLVKPTLASQNGLKVLLSLPNQNYRAGSLNQLFCENRDIKINVAFGLSANFASDFRQF